MQQVRESDLPPCARTLVVRRRRSQESAGVRPRSERLRVAVLAPPVVRRAAPRATAAPRQSSACSSTGLVRRGHDVTLFASGDSRTRGEPRLAPSRSRAATTSGLTQPELLHALTCVRDAERFDVVSDHTGALGLALSNLTSTPFLNTVHGTLAGEAGALYRQRLRGHARRGARVADREPSRDARPTCPGPPRSRMPSRSTTTRAGRDSGGEYLFWLGRMSAGQGPRDGDRGRARRRACRCCSPASCAAPPSRRTSSEEVEPLLGGGIAYVGEIDLHERVRLLHGARALVNPLAWDEPFGLVMVEAMACGVP